MFFLELYAVGDCVIVKYWMVDFNGFVTII